MPGQCNIPYHFWIFRFGLQAKVNDNRWHQILIARRGKSVVMQVDGLEPSRTAVPHGSNVLVTNGRYWIGTWNLVLNNRRYKAMSKQLI